MLAARRFRTFRWLAALLLGLAASPAAATNYDVGPGLALEAIADVPWESLGPGDLVRIHYRPEPYREKWVIGRSGTAQAPIVVRGVLGPNGERPGDLGRPGNHAARPRLHRREPRRAEDRHVERSPRVAARAHRGGESRDPLRPSGVHVPRRPRRHAELRAERRGALRRARAAPGDPQLRAARLGQRTLRRRLLRRHARHHDRRQLDPRQRQCRQHLRAQHLHGCDRHRLRGQPLRTAARGRVRQQPEGPLGGTRGAQQLDRGRQPPARSRGRRRHPGDRRRPELSRDLRLRQRADRAGRRGQQPDHPLRRRQRRRGDLPQGHAVPVPQHGRVESLGQHDAAAAVERRRVRRRPQQRALRRGHRRSPRDARRDGQRSISATTGPSRAGSRATAAPPASSTTAAASRARRPASRTRGRRTSGPPTAPPSSTRAPRCIPMRCRTTPSCVSTASTRRSEARPDDGFPDLGAFEFCATPCPEPASAAASCAATAALVALAARRRAR